VPFIEDTLPPALVLRACELYASGQVGLRGAAKLLKVARGGKRAPISAMTMAEILRRHGFAVRERSSVVPPQAPAAPESDTHAAIASESPNLAVPWTVGVNAPAINLPPPPAVVLDVQAPDAPEPNLASGGVNLASSETPARRSRLYLNEPFVEALRRAGGSLCARLDLDPALPPREADALEWQASLAWRRMLVACLWAAETDRRWSAMPVAEKLLTFIGDAKPPEEHVDKVLMYYDWTERALEKRDERRGAQYGLYAVFTYGARAVRELDPERTFAFVDRTICGMFREVFPEPPPDFRLVGA
jgi:hypothetical protein